MSTIDDYVELTVDRGYFWTVNPEGVRFGSPEGGQEFALSGQAAVLTTGMSLSMVPKSISQPFFKRLLEGSGAVEDNGVFFTNCQE